MIEYELRGGNKMIKLRLKERDFGRVIIILCVIIVTVCNSLKRKKTRHHRRLQTWIILN